jgi:nucleotide-binding universal stress UspA family protein
MLFRGETPMKNEQSVLFGIDDSDFARHALLEAGRLLKDSKDLHMTLFHGALEPDVSLLPDAISQDPDVAETYLEKWNLKAQEVAAQAKNVLMESGFAPERTSTFFDNKCNAPADAMLTLAGQKGIETVAVARWGKSTVSRKVIGSVTYRLSQLANDRVLWVIEPRITSRNVLIGLVGAEISQRVVDYSVRYFSHLRESTFTLFHVIPPIPPQYWVSDSATRREAEEKHEKMVSWLKEYTDRVREIADDAREKLVQAGVPEENIVFKCGPQKEGIARDMALELQEGKHGILVIGRKGYKNIEEFGLGSKANKLLLAGRAFLICLVN